MIWSRTSVRTGECLELSQITLRAESVTDVPRLADAVERLLKDKHKYEDYAVTVPLELSGASEKYSPDVYLSARIHRGDFARRRWHWDYEHHARYRYGTNSRDRDSTRSVQSSATSFASS